MEASDIKRLKDLESEHAELKKIYAELCIENRAMKNPIENIRLRAKRRLPARIKEALLIPDHPNEVWSIDFMSDALVDGRKFRLLTSYLAA